MFQDRAQRWPRVISRRRRRRSTTRRFNTPWIATRNVSTFTFYCYLFVRLPLSSRFMTLKRERRAGVTSSSCSATDSCFVNDPSRRESLAIFWAIHRRRPDPIRRLCNRLGHTAIHRMFLSGRTATDLGLVTVKRIHRHRITSIATTLFPVQNGATDRNGRSTLAYHEFYRSRNAGLYPFCELNFFSSHRNERNQVSFFLSMLMRRRF